MPSVSIVVQGRVQGVGFRAHAARIAAQLGITGEVWNRRDGAVEVLASHPDQATLDRFAELLKTGPGYVDHVWVDSTDREPKGDRFDIGPTR